MSSTFARGVAALILVVLSPSISTAQDQKGDLRAGDLSIHRPWSRATPNGAQVAGAYLTITNQGTVAETLTGGSAEVAAKVEMHDMSTSNGIMTMRPTGPLTIPPGTSVTFSPSGRHIMLIGLRRGLRKGDRFTGTLDFARAGKVAVTFEVEGIGAKAPADTTEPANGMKMD